MAGHRWIRHSKLTNRQLGKLIDLFILEVPARKAAQSLGINRHSAERVYHTIRLCLARDCERRSPFQGEVEVDETYFGGKQKWLRGRGAAAKVPVFGILKRSGKVYTRIVEDISRYTLQQIIRRKVRPDSTIYSDSFVSYDGLVLYGYRHYRINHAQHFRTEPRSGVTSTGSRTSGGYAKTRLKRYHGISRSHFYLYLKEMEFRFNHRNHPNIGLLMRQILKRANTVLD